MDKSTEAPKRPGRPRKYATASEKQAAYLARHELVPVTCNLPEGVAAALRERLAKRNMDKDPWTLGELVADLITKQLLRKR